MESYQDPQRWVRGRKPPAVGRVWIRPPSILSLLGGVSGAVNVILGVDLLWRLHNGWGWVILGCGIAGLWALWYSFGPLRRVDH